MAPSQTRARSRRETPVTDQTNPLTPKQADREAAAAYYRAHYGHGTTMEARLRDGQHDSQALVQAFAHHAQQARLEERDAVVYEIIAMQRIDADGQDQKGHEAHNAKLRAIAEAIRKEHAG